MPRYAVVMKWKPEKTPEVLKRFGEFVSGKYPKILEAYKRVNYIVWDFPSAYGQCVNVSVVEGDAADMSTINRFWMDLMKIKVLPSVDLKTILKFYPDSII
jgi:hypothetical protein